MIAPEALVALALVLAAAVVLVRRHGLRRSLPAGLVVAVVASGVALALYASGLRGMRFGHPWALALAGFALFAAAWRSPPHRPYADLRERASRWSLSIAVALAALAAASPERAAPSDHLAVIFAVDRSRSMELVPDAAARSVSFERSAIEGMRDGDRVGRVVFGANSATEEPPRARRSPASSAQAIVSRDASDIGSALRRALAELPSDSAGRVVLVTDGAENRGDLLAAGVEAGAAGVPVDVALLRRSQRPDLRVEAVRGPSTADEGEGFDLRVVTRSTVATDVEVRVVVDGSVAQRARARVDAGEDVLTLPQTATIPGLHRYVVEVVTRDRNHDAVPENNRGGRVIRVRGPSSVLVLEGDPGASAPLSNTLRRGGFRVVERGQNGFPDDLAELASFDLVVLSDVPARALAPAQMEQLRTYVRELGGGLLLMGGDRSLGPGGYSRTPVEEISPVRFDLRQERRRASLSEVISIDYSGSMSAVVGGFTKLQLANEAAGRSAMLLGPEDHLGVAHVDTVTAWTVPLAPIGDLPSVLRRIRGVSMGGGGILVPIALRDAYASLRGQRTNLRHLLLFADGDDAEDMPGCAATVATAFREGITTSVVSLGRGVDTPELEHLAREGHGRFYLVEDALRLPAVFAQETVLATRAAIREESFRPRLGAPDEVTSGIAFAQAPALGGYVVTVPKPRAAVLLRGPDDDPLLASWQVGVGRVAVFTSDAKDRWGAGWIPWVDGQRFFVSLARSVVRRDDGRVRAEAEVRGGVLRVRALATAADGRSDSLRRLSAVVIGPDESPRTVALDPTGHGGYAGELTLPRTGAWTIAVRDEATGVLVATTGALALDGEEFRPAESDALIERLTAITGGRVITDGRDVFAQRARPRLAWVAIAPWLLPWIIASLLASLAARRLALPDAVARWIEARRGAPAPTTADAARERDPTSAVGVALSKRHAKHPLARTPARVVATQAPRTLPDAPPRATPLHAPPRSVGELAPAAPASSVLNALKAARQAVRAPERGASTPAVTTPRATKDRPPVETAQPQARRPEGSGSVRALLERKRALRGEAPSGDER